MTFKIFVTCDDDVRLSRRMLRDIKERGRDTEGVLYQYHRFVKPSFNVYFIYLRNLLNLQLIMQILLFQEEDKI